MNREIMFRGKRVDNGEWVYGYFIENESDIYRAYIVTSARWETDEDGDTDLIETDTYEVDPSTVGQYTGLLDRNGVKIFEGDILNENGYYFTVVYDARNAKFKLRYVRIIQYPEWNRGVLMEVIGNIHDHPELLEGHAK